MIVGRSGLLTTGTDPFGIEARPDLDFDGIGFCAQARLLVDEAWKALAVVQKGDQLHVEVGAMTNASTLQQSAAPGLDDDCKDLAEWPRSWMGLPKDLVPGEKMVAYFRPFWNILIDLGLSKKTIRKHVDNLWILGGRRSAICIQPHL